jgi:DNA-directed RNA polymerase specialized sigma24 family protein
MSDGVATMIASDDPSVGFRAVAALRRLADQVEARSVQLARVRGWSWDQIGDALGVSRQSVHARFGRRRTR